MSGRRLILLRHAAVETDPALPRERWPLSDEGRRSVRALSRSRLWRPVERIFTSPELKAQETAQIIAGVNGITVTVVEELAEAHRRRDTWFSDYGAAVAAWFASPAEAVHDWEPAADAQARMTHTLGRLLDLEPQPFALAGHGLTLSLLAAALTGEDAAVMWPEVRFPDVAVIDLHDGRFRRPFGRA